MRFTKKVKCSPAIYDDFQILGTTLAFHCITSAHLERLERLERLEPWTPGTSTSTSTTTIIIIIIVIIIIIIITIIILLILILILIMIMMKNKSSKWLQQPCFKTAEPWNI